MNLINKLLLMLFSVAFFQKHPESLKSQVKVEIQYDYLKVFTCTSMGSPTPPVYLLVMRRNFGLLGDRHENAVQVGRELTYWLL